MKHKVGDKVLLKQTKTTVKPPFDPEAYEVEEIRGTEITARRGKKRVTRNVQRWKQMKERPAYLRKQGTGIDGQQDSDEEDDWEYGLSVTAPGQQVDEQVQEEQAEAAEEQARGVVQRHIPQERWEVALGPWRSKKITSLAPGRGRGGSRPLGIGTRSRGPTHTSSGAEVWLGSRKKRRCRAK